MKKFIAPLLTLSVIFTACSPASPDQDLELSSEDDSTEVIETEEVKTEDSTMPYPVDEDECQIFFSDGFIELKPECEEDFFTFADEEEKHEEPEHEPRNEQEPPRHVLVGEDDCHFYFEDGFVEMKPECHREEFKNEEREEFHEEKHEEMPDRSTIEAELGLDPYEEHQEEFREQFDKNFEEDFQTHNEQQVEHLREEVDRILKMLEDAEAFADRSSEEFADDEGILLAIEKVYEMIERSHEALEEMKDEFEAGTAQHHWQKIDKIRHAAHKQMEKLHRRIGERGHQGGGEFEFVEKMDEGRAEEIFHQHYGEDFDFDTLKDELDFDVVDEMVRNVPEEMMGQAMQHMRNPNGKHLMTNLMNNMHVLDERATQMMEYSIELMEVMEEVEIEDEDDPRYDHLKMMFEKSMTFLSEDTHEEIINFWLEVRDVVARGATDEELASFASDIEALLEANKDALVKEGVQFHDVLLEDDDWYFEHVIDLKERGVIDGKRNSDGDLTGEYEPGSNVTNAEMLKILLESAGEGQSNSDYPGLEGKWYAKYVAQANGLGLDLVNDWNAEANRGMVAIWTAQIFDLDQEFNGEELPFNDINPADSHAAHYQAVYEYEIFSGDGETGNLNPEDPINRAEAAKVAGKVIENVVEVESLDF